MINKMFSERKDKGLRTEDILLFLENSFYISSSIVLIFGKYNINTLKIETYILYRDRLQKAVLICVHLKEQNS